MSWSKGEMAEEFVAQKLSASGWVLRERNYRRKGHELDIIASRDLRLICVEVKARSSSKLLHPTQIINFRKFSKLHDGMLLWLSDRAPEEMRNAEFWLCSVLLPTSKNTVEWIRLEI